MSLSFLQYISIAKITARAHLILWKCHVFSLWIRYCRNIYWHQKEELVNLKILQKIFWVSQGMIIVYYQTVNKGLHSTSPEYN